MLGTGNVKKYFKKQIANGLCTGFKDRKCILKQNERLNNWFINIINMKTFKLYKSILIGQYQQEKQKAFFKIFSNLQ